MSEQSNVETVATLDGMGKQKGDQWRLRIMRRAREHAPPQVWACFDDASVLHFAQPEAWLSELAAGGGGLFELTAYHLSDPVLPIGGIIRVTIDGDPKPPDLSVVARREWGGPRKITYPRAQPAPEFTMGRPLGDGTGTAPRTEFGIPFPGAPFPHPATPMSAAAMAAGVGSGQHYDPHSVSRLAAAEEALERRQRVLDERESRIRESSLRDEILGAVKQELGSRGSDKPTGTMELVGALAPVLTGIVGMMQANAQESSKRMEALMQAVMTRPGIAPEMMIMIDKLSSKGGSEAGILAPIVEGMGAMTNTMMQLVHTAAELSTQGPGPAPEPGWVKALRETAKMVVAMANVQAEQTKSLARGGAGGPLRSVPQPAQPAQQPPRPASVMDRIENAIRAHQDPAYVAKAFFGAVKKREPSVVAALAATGGDVEELFKKRLGAWGFTADNLGYVRQLDAAMDKIGSESGLLEPDEKSPMERAEKVEEPEDVEGNDETEETVETEEEEPDEEPTPVEAPAAQA